MAARDISIESGHSDILPSLISAISAGDLTLTTQILNDWKKSPDPNPKRVEKAPFHALQPALETALQKNQLQIAAYFLDQGFHITDTVVECAIEAQSTDGLELLLEHGWAVNNRWAGYKLPSIW